MLSQNTFAGRRGYCKTSFPGDSYDVAMLGNSTLGCGSTHYSPGAKTVLAPVFVNKVLLEHSHVHLFIYCLSLLSHYHNKFE